MLSRLKVSYLAAAAMLAIVAGTVAAPNMAAAQSGTQLAQAEHRDGDNRRSESRRGHRNDNATANRSHRNVTTRTVVRRDSHNDHRRVVVRRDNWRYGHNYGYGYGRGYGYGYGYRSYAAAPAAFVVLGPSVVYTSYGSGYCRALHSGRHWAPRAGWHRGRHVGAVRCG